MDILVDEVDTDPAVVAAVDGRGPNELWTDKDFQQAVLAKVLLVTDLEVVLEVDGGLTWPP